ncbi:MAG: hypothetical protein NZ519_10315 [Bacteroidia bacterium]|nr:hypothetical protein [Bacteroidia bacterium]MDW8302081.1 hypothetical protein [Bacteroidia bacterium]
MSAAKRPQGHAQKRIKILTLSSKNSTLCKTQLQKIPIGLTFKQSSVLDNIQTK